MVLYASLSVLAILNVSNFILIHQRSKRHNYFNLDPEISHILDEDLIRQPLIPRSEIHSSVASKLKASFTKTFKSSIILCTISVMIKYYVIIEFNSWIYEIEYNRVDPDTMAAFIAHHHYVFNLICYFIGAFISN